MGSIGANGVVAVLACMTLASGCGDATGPAAARTAANPSASALPQKLVVHGTGHLQVEITPVKGPVGTEVTVSATGCGDPEGRNHAVGFNPGFGNTLQAANAGYHPADITSHLERQTLTATYRISAEDARAAAAADASPPQFTVQCADDLADAAFTITH